MEPAFPNDAFNWWLCFPELHSVALHYRNTRPSSSTDKLVKNARAILIPLHGATTNINLVSFEFDFNLKLPFGPSTSDYKSLINEPRWKKWSSLCLRLGVQRRQLM